MKTLPLLICSIFSIFCSVNAEKKTTKLDPVLLKAEESIRTSLSNIVTELTFEYPEHYPNTLLVKYQSRKFMIHGGSMIGKYSETAHETDGPDYKGFILRLSVQEKGTSNQAITPQTLTRPYWKTYLQVTVVDNSDKQLYWGLSYGARTDKKLMKTIRKTINSMGTLSSNQLIDHTWTTPALNAESDSQAGHE